MTIKTKLLFSILATAILISFAGFVTYQKVRQIERENEKMTIAQKIVRLATSRRGLVLDYSRYHGERPKEQWKSLLDTQAELTQNEAFDTPSERSHLKQINETSELVKSIFVELVANYEKSKSSQTELAFSKELEEVLVSQLLTQIQTNIDRAYALSDNSLTNLKTAQNMLVFTATASVAVLFLFLVALLFLFNHFIAKPLTKLQEVAVRIASLDFSSTTTTTTNGSNSNDEIGILSHAFNTMTTKLKESYETLEQKVRVRTKDLENANIAIRNVIEDLNIKKSEIEIAKAKDEAILASIGDGVMACDVDGKIVLFNRIASELSGFSIKEALGKHYRQILSFVKEDTGQPSRDFIGQAIKEGKIMAMANHTMIIRKDGTKISVDDSAAPILDLAGKIIGCVVVFSDVTKEREINKAKTEFISLVSHQLRTPLTTISWYTEMILNGDVGQVVPSQKKYLEEIYKGDRRMINLVDTLLDVSRLEMETLVSELKLTNIVALAKSVLAEQKLNITRKKLIVTKNFSQDIPILSIDLERLRIVFQNLLANAVEYTPTSGKIDFEISLDPPSHKASAGQSKLVSVFILLNQLWKILAEKFGLSQPKTKARLFMSHCLIKFSK